MGLSGEVREEDEAGGKGPVVHGFIAKRSKGGRRGEAFHGLCC